MADSGVSGPELWERVLEQLQGQMTLATFRSVFGGSQAGFFDGETLDVALVSKSACEWATERLAGVVADTARYVTGCPVVVRFSAAKVTANGAKGAKENEESESPPWVPPKSGGEGVEAEVKDQRRVGWYRVDNVVLDDYLPFMGIRAFAVYSLYCRMSGRDGLSWPGYGYVCETLKIGRGTLAKCNKLLVVLGLIEVDRGNQERSNRYYLLEPEVLTFEVLTRIRERAEAAGLDVLASAVGEELKGQEGGSVQNYPSSPRELPQFSPGTTLVPTENYPSSPREPEQDTVNKTQEQEPGTRDREKREGGAKGAKNLSDSELADWLEQLGIVRSVALKLIVTYERELIIAWVEYTLEQENIKRPAAFLVHKLKQGGWP